MNDCDIENEIVTIINHRGVCRTTDVIMEISEKFKDGRGFSEKTIYRKIGALKHQNMIAELDKSSYALYGVKETDKRAKYLISSSYIETRGHIDKILTYPLNKDKATIISVLEEIKRYDDEYALTPKQLDVLLKIPLIDGEIVVAVLSIFHENVFTKNSEPTDTRKFILNLRSIVKTFKNNWTVEGIETISEIFNLNEKPDLRNVYFTALKLLAHYNNNTVIECLKEDFTDPERWKYVGPNYHNARFAQVIQKNTNDLFDFQMHLRQNGKYIAARDIGSIRDMAKRTTKGKSSLSAMKNDQNQENTW